MRRTRWTAVVLALATTVAAAAPAFAADVAVLVLHTYGHDSPGRIPFDSAFARTVREAPGVKVDLYIETLDLTRLAGEAQARRTREYVRAKYADKPIAVVVPVFDEALAFILDARDPLFPSVPVAAMVLRAPDPIPARVALLLTGNFIGDAVALALKLHPGTQRIALIDGAPGSSGRDASQAEALSQIAAAAPRTTVVPLKDLPFEDLLARVAALPPDTVIFYLRQNLGPAGAPIGRVDGLRAVARVARAPIYGTTDQDIGAGAVGGIVISIDGQASELAALAVRVATTGALPASPARGRRVPMFDWRQLRRWGIDEHRLPPGSTIRFRQLTVWDRYKSYIVGSILLLGTQTLLITGLVAQMSRRRRIEAALRASEEHLRRSLTENQDLAGRLIHAHEAERTRIARDLHDDLGHQLAGLGITLSRLKRTVGTSDAEPDVERTVATLQDRTAALAQTVRNLSHELHPSVLQHTGLAATLRRHCADVERHHRLTVTFTAEGPLDSLRTDQALCLFRVAQEGLTNAVRHAGAGTIHVWLTANSTDTDLTVSDDGNGVVDRDRAARGLGLRSIDERVRHAGGRFRLHARPGQGTSLLVRMPHPSPPDAPGEPRADVTGR